MKRSPMNLHRLILIVAAWTSGAAMACTATTPNSIVDDCSFEASSVSGNTTINSFWTSDVDDVGFRAFCDQAFCSMVGAHTGSWWLLFEPFLTNATNATYSVSQSITLPNQQMLTLAFWYRAWRCNTPGSRFRVFMGTTMIHDRACVVGDYQRVFVDISSYRNSTRLLRFTGFWPSVVDVAQSGYLVDDVAVLVGPLPSTTTLTSNPSPSPIGTPVQLTATVTGLAPTGTVRFRKGTTDLPGCAAVPLTAGQATCQAGPPQLTVGNNNLSAVYSGNTQNATSTGTLVHTVVRASSSTAIGSACALGFTQGQNFTMDAAVAGYNPTGNVSFEVDGAALAGCGAVALDGSGMASCTSAAIAAGTHALTARYAGNGNNLVSLSAPLPVRVLDAADVVFRNGVEEVVPGCPAQ